MKKGNIYRVFFGLVLAVFLTLAGGCNGDQCCNDNNCGQPAVDPLPGYLAEIDRYIQQGMVDWQIPGMTVAIVRGNTVLFQKAYGVKKLGGNDPVTLDTLFQIGSTSKSFTTALMAMDVGDGKYGWHDQVLRHLPDFQMYDPWVTDQFMVVDLSAQRSGMPTQASGGVILYGFSRQHVIDTLQYIPPVSSFRTEFAYQNNLFLVDAALIEKYSGKTWEQNVRDRIFRPLGMTNSSADQVSYQTAANVATPHRRIAEQIVPLPMDWHYMYWLYNYGPAGGINSNIIDMSRYIRLHFNNGAFEGQQLIKESNAEFVHSPQTIFPPATDQPKQAYCQGWVWREFYPYNIIWHNGRTSGCKTMLAFIPEAKLGVVVLSNLDDHPFADDIAYRFFDMYFGHPFRDWSHEDLVKAIQKRADDEANKPVPPPFPAPHRPLAEYEGDYYNSVYETVNVAVNGDGLLVTIGPKHGHMWLRPWDGDTFMSSYDVYIVMEDIGFATFEADAGGHVTSMTLDSINDNGTGVLIKI